ncbi:MAG: DegT/DnrJ/EryC1/StrS family aminotransferase [ANME-2 cluster archaeon]|nr:DegT/DnrJ/EryC1/StrS family aminotransferase [ANME-2 cluster archaeon]MBC2701876.1 DegT/DnrJ/EryC1/StrS family aminotransferase [ANME-2 cluster archaeon]MBC2708408.1 DegT/DnrJ/EryC1/StrS family aminotransferase [ANME-2 cluster archaeon]MBC2746826.1 DegT/DnrJ/EryC1/StrS family aminotransferase [ANME-2 cluster archaeon]MBC2762735.1 DegT/DnrJ/EryC1/StrS family aminotransferase [ANME-2 cluster archaeon]
MIPIAKPLLGADEVHAVTDAIMSAIIAEGPRVADFEQAFADYIDVEHAIAVNSGTAALHATLLAHGIGDGNEVITTPFTFIATSNSVLFTGARPVFVDIDEDTFNINPDAIMEKITQKTKAILPIHLYGHPADMNAIMEIAEDHNLAVIEDACQAHGAVYNKKKVGSFGTGTFSFYPTKNMTTSEGGMITTNDQNIADRARMIRSHGSRKRYVHEMLGYNFRMTDISASIGLVQLNKLDEFTRKRQNNAEYLSGGLKGIDGITVPIVGRNCEHVFHQYTIRAKDRDELVKTLNEKGVGTGIYYPIPTHKQLFYQELGYNDSMPKCEIAASEVISLPVHPSVTQNELDYVIEVIKGAE